MNSGRTAVRRSAGSSTHQVHSATNTGHHLKHYISASYCPALLPASQIYRKFSPTPSLRIVLYPVLITSTLLYPAESDQLKERVLPSFVFYNPPRDARPCFRFRLSLRWSINFFHDLLRLIASLLTGPPQLQRRTVPDIFKNIYTRIGASIATCNSQRIRSTLPVKWDTPSVSRVAIGRGQPAFPFPFFLFLSLSPFLTFIFIILQKSKVLN